MVIGFVTACEQDDTNQEDGDTQIDGDNSIDGDDDPDPDAFEMEDLTPHGDDSVDGDDDPDTAELEEITPDGDMDIESDDAELLPEEILAMTFNLRTGLGLDGDNAWNFRRAMVAEVIELQAPAFLGVQEAWDFQIEYIMENVTNYSWVGVSRSEIDSFDEYCAVFFNTGLFSLVDSDTFWLSDTPDVPATTFSSNQLVARIVTWAALKSRASGRILYVFNTHFDTSNDDQIPEKSASLLTQKIDEIAGSNAVIVMGDFNEEVDSDAYRILTGDMEFEGVSGNLIDPWKSLELTEEGTFHNFTGTALHESRIDWILGTENLLPLSGEVLHIEKDGMFPSDHFPVTCTYSW